MGRSVGHWLRVGVVSCALGSLAVGAAAVPVGGAVHATGSLIKVGDDCTFGEFGPVVGSVLLRRTGDEMKLYVRFNGAIPYSDYSLYLYGGPSRTDSCSPLADLGALTTNWRGDASGSYVSKVSSSDRYFFFAASNTTTEYRFGTNWNESSLFYLP